MKNENVKVNRYNTFYEYLKEKVKSLGKDETFEFDSIIDDVDMPCTVVLTHDLTISQKCFEKFRPIFLAKCKENIYEDDIVLELETENGELYNKGEKFIWAISGYIGASIYDSYFKTGVWYEEPVVVSKEQ